MRPRTLFYDSLFWVGSFGGVKVDSVVGVEKPKSVPRVVYVCGAQPIRGR